MVGSSEANLKDTEPPPDLAPIVVSVDEADATLGCVRARRFGVDARIFRSLRRDGDTRNRALL